MSSLRRKIILNFGAFAALLAGVSAVYVLELRLIGDQIESGGRIREFFDVALEIRRFEKNFFLYHQPVDLRENAEFLARARELLDEHEPTFGEFAGAARLDRLRRKLEEYGARMATNAQVRPLPAAAAAEIRALGTDIVTESQSLADAERASLRHRLDQHRRVLLVTLGVLLAALALSAAVVSRGIVRPLKDMEASMATVAAGGTCRLTLAARDREIVSLVTAFNHMLDEIRLRQQQQLIQSDRLASLGRLISGVAHEINNPLSNVSTSAQILIEEESGTDRSWRREILAQIDDETVRAQRIVRSLLDYARQREFRREPAPLRAIVNDTLRFVRNEIPARVSLGVDIPEELTIQADKPRLQQVFLNLLKNSVEAMDGAGEIHIAAVRRAADDPATPPCLRGDPREASDAEVVDIEVRDDGSGIPPETLPHVFEPFYSTKETSRGSGLGLFIVREIVEEHGGRIAVESDPGRRTAFYIRLPQSGGTLKEPS